MDRYYKYFRWLSMDIVLGAIFFLAYLENYFHVNLTLNVYFALASAIWLIYTADHLIDARSIDKASSGRHIFHQVHFHKLICIGGLVLSLSLINVYFLDTQIIKNGALLSAICITYLLGVYFVKKLWVKEVVVAVVYAAGIFLAPVTLAGLGVSEVVLIIQLIVVALLNLLVFSYYDFHTDQKDGFNSLVIRIGKDKASLLIKCLIAAVYASVLLTSLTGSTRSNELQVLYFLMTTMLLVIHLSPGFFSTNNRYRTLGDGIFYLPGLLMLL